MDLNLLLAWIVATSCVLGLVRLASAPWSETSGWKLIFGGLLVLLAVGWLVFPDVAGFVAGAAWALLLLVPTLTSHVVLSLVFRRKYEAALFFSRLQALLHPMDGWRDQPKIIRAQQLISTGRLDEARALLAGLSRADSPLGRAALLLDAQVTGEWRRLLEWVDRQERRERVLADPSMAVGYLWALGEAGERERMLRLLPSLAAAQRNVLNLSFVRLHVAAHVGLVATVEGLLAGPLASLSPETKAMTLATAHQVAGDLGRAEEQLALAEQHRSPSTLKRIAERRERPLPPLTETPLSDEARRIRTQLAADVEGEGEYAVLSSAPRRPVRATWAVVATLLVVFLLEVVGGGSTDVDNLVRLGALVLPVEQTDGEWWRRLTAGFLHLGPTHLLLNVLSLLILGRWLERAWGPTALLLCYLGATLASTVLLPSFVHLEPGEVSLMVGASGGVLGLLGALLAHMLRGLRTRNPLVRRQLGLLVLLVTMQIAFDLATPIVSSEAHMIGLVTGFLIGVLVRPRR